MLSEKRYGSEADSWITVLGGYLLADGINDMQQDSYQDGYQDGGGGDMGGGDMGGGDMGGGDF